MKEQERFRGCPVHNLPICSRRIFGTWEWAPKGYMYQKHVPFFQIRLTPPTP